MEIKADNSVKVRPININDPIDKIGSHLLAVANGREVVDICGKFQLGNGIAGGVEILVWTVKVLLDLNPEFVLFKSDCSNAFNSGYHSKIMEKVNEKLPQTAAYAYMLLKQPLQIDFTNHKAKKCMRATMERGVPQGNPMSGTFFNILRVDSLAEVRNAHQNVFLLSFQDDDYFIGRPDDVFEAVTHFDECMGPLGIERNRGKCEIYDPNGQHENLEA
jgi:hypothetical protein